MRFWYNDPMIDPSFYLPLVREVERAGFDGMTFAENLGYPEAFNSEYPYYDGGNDFLEGKPILEPYALIGFLGAATTTLQFATFVSKVPMRAPVLSAKAVATLAALTNNRFLFGVGISPWAEDFEICDIDPAKKGKRLDESVEIIEGLLTGEFFEFHGEVLQMPSFKMAPSPSKRVPILVGGHSDAALRRAVRIGDGWMSASLTLEETTQMLGRIEELKAERPGGPPADFRTFVLTTEGRTVEGVERLIELGLTDVIVTLRDNLYGVGPDGQSLGEKIDNVGRFGEEIIAAFR